MAKCENSKERKEKTKRQVWKPTPVLVLPHVPTKNRQYTWQDPLHTCQNKSNDLTAHETPHIHINRHIYFEKIHIRRECSNRKIKDTSPFSLNILAGIVHYDLFKEQITMD